MESLNTFTKSRAGHEVKRKREDNINNLHPWQKDHQIHRLKKRTLNAEDGFSESQHFYPESETGCQYRPINVDDSTLSKRPKFKSDDEMFGFSSARKLLSRTNGHEYVIGTSSHESSMEQKKEAIKRLKLKREKRKMKEEQSQRETNTGNDKRRDLGILNYIGWPSESDSSSSSDDEKLLSRVINKKRPRDSHKTTPSFGDVLHKQIVGPTEKHSFKNSNSFRNTNSSTTSFDKCLYNKKQKTASPVDHHSKLSFPNIDVTDSVNTGFKSKYNDMVKNELAKSHRGATINNSAISPIFKKRKKIPVSPVKSPKSLTESYQNAPMSPDLFASPSPNKSSLCNVVTPETPAFVGHSKPSTRPPKSESPDLVIVGISSPEINFSSPFQPKRRISRVPDAEKKNTATSSKKAKRIDFNKTEENVVKLVEQLNNDEDYARKLQEEMDKEFALSLAQSESSNFNPPPLPQLFPSGHNGFNPPNLSHFENLYESNWQTPPAIYQRTGNNSRLPQNQRRRANDFLDNHLLALVQDTPPRRGRRRNQRQTRPRVGIMLQSPLGDGNDYEALLQLAEQVGDAQPKGINNGQINRLPIKKFRKSETNTNAGEECSICMCEYVENDTMRILQCFHCFHSGCVDKWLETNASCPVCRVDVKLD